MDVEFLRKEVKSEMANDLTIIMMTARAAEATGRGQRPNTPEHSFAQHLDAEKSRVGMDRRSESRELNVGGRNERKKEVEDSNPKETGSDKLEKDNKTLQTKEGTEKDSQEKTKVKETEKVEEKGNELDQEHKDILEQAARLMGISVEELTKFLKLHQSCPSDSKDSKLEMILGKLAELISADQSEKPNILSQVKELLGGMDEKFNLKVGVAKQVLIQESDSEEGKQTEQPVESSTVEETTAADSKNRQETPGLQNSGQGTQNNRKTSSNLPGGETQKQDVKNEGEQENGESNKAGSRWNPDEGEKSWRESVKLNASGEKPETIFKVNEENSGQLENKVNDTKDVRLETKNTRQAYVSKEEVIKQIINKAVATVTEDKAQMVIDLKPDHLGKLVLKVVTERGIVTAQMVAENQQVKQLIESNFNMLKDALEKQGITVQQFSVSVGQDSMQRDQRQTWVRELTSQGKDNRNISGVQEGNSGYYESGQSDSVNMWPNSTISFTA